MSSAAPGGDVPIVGEMEDVIDRFIVVDGCRNVRDLGGYVGVGGRMVRWGRLLRADGPDRMTADGRATIDRLGVATVIDFRNQHEKGGQAFHPAAITMPMADAPDTDWSAATLTTTDDLARRYYTMATSSAETISATLELLGERLDRPALIHCAAGKDRTGILAALVLALVGVNDEVIAADYGLSHESGIRHRDSLTRFAPERAEHLHNVAPIAFTAHPATMATFLELVRERHRTVRDFVESLGTPTYTADDLRAHLLV